LVVGILVTGALVVLLGEELVLVGALVAVTSLVTVVMTRDSETVTVVLEMPSARFGATTVRVVVVFASVVVEFDVMLLAVLVTATVLPLVAVMVTVTLLGSLGLVVVATPAAEVSVVKTVTDAGLFEVRVLVLVIVPFALAPLTATTV
jgi:hypothetical protein